MKIHLSFLKTRLLALMLFLAGCLAFGQTLLADFPLTGSPITATTNLVGGSIALSNTTTFNNNRVYFDQSTDNIVFSGDTTNRDNLYITFYTRGDFPWYSLWTNIIVEANTGTAGAWQNVRTFSIGQGAGLRTVELPAATYNKSDLQIRIRYETGWWGDDKVWIDSFKLYSRSAEIRVYNNTGNIFIPHESPASTVYGTDFGLVQTTGTGNSVRTIRVRNLGQANSQLKVSNITVTGSNPADFTPSVTSLANIGVSTATDGGRTFTITFKPTGDGIRTAQINIYSNTSPSPYVFNVIGMGASCSLDRMSFAENKMENGQQTLYTIAPNGYTTADLITGNANPANQNNLNTRLYPDGALYKSSPTSFYFRGGNNVPAKTLGFGGSNGNNIINISQLKKVSIEFDVASFTTTNKPYHWFSNPNTIDDPENGLNNESYITLSVLRNGTFVEVMRLNGANASNRYYRYNFSGSNPFEVDYIDGQSLTTVGNSGNSGNSAYNRFKLNLPASVSSQITDLQFRITAFTNSNARLWLIDDVKVVSESAQFKVYNNGWVSGAPSNDGNQKLVVEAGTLTSPTGNQSLYVCECEVRSGATVNILQDRSIKIRNRLINEGTFTVNSGGNLIQEEEVQNIGEITVKRNVVFSDLRKEYNFFSSPVYNQNMRALFGAISNTPYAQIFEEPNNIFKTATLDDYKVLGRGFAVKEPKKTYTTTVAEFKGVPNNGTVNYPVTRAADNRGWNLIGNPYPSNIDIKAIYDGTEIIDGSTTPPTRAILPEFRFWDNTVNATYTYNGTYGQYSYAIFNAANGANGGGTAAPGLDPTGVGGPTPASTKVPNRYVSVGQGFIVRPTTTAGGTVVFNNAKRFANAPQSTYFGKGAQEAEDDRFQLLLVTPKNIALMQTVTYFDGGSAGFGIDDSKHPGLSSMDLFYSFAEDEKVIISGLPAFDTNAVLPLGYRAYETGMYSIKLYSKEGVFSTGQAIYLVDKLNNVYTDLTQGNYEFSTEAGDFTNRFEIVYEPEATTLAVQNTVKESLIVYRSGSDFVIKSEGANITAVEAYDMSGRLVKKIGANAREVALPDYLFNNGVYILKIWQGTQISTKKIIK